MSFSDSIGNFFDGLGDWFQSLFDPIVLDLDGDGVELVGLDASTAHFDFDGDGVSERTGWVGSDDGLLVFDANGDGVIDARNEVAFIDYGPGARSDLEGLAAFDANHDGHLSQADAEVGGFDWDSFMVWRDLDQDGVSDEGELVSLTAIGIASINLARNGAASEVEGNLIHNTTTFTRTDGSVGAAADVTFVAQTHGADTLALNDNVVGVVTDLGTSGLIIGAAEHGLTVNGTERDDVIVFSEMNDVFLVRGGAGFDTVAFTGAAQFEDFEFQRIDELGVLGVRNRESGETFYVANDVEQLILGNHAVDLDTLWA